MQQYKDLIKDILENGVEHSDRTTVGTKRVFGRMMRFNLQDGFPVVTVKKTPIKLSLRELLFFLSGGSTLEEMHPSIRHWWTPFADDKGFLGGGTYGKSFRDFSDEYSNFDQLDFLISEIKSNPSSRRLVMTSFQPVRAAYDYLCGDANYLYPCHGYHTQFQVNHGKLSCFTTQRSADCFLGIPVNICEYAYLTHIIANICGLEVGELVYTIADAHIYLNHTDQCIELLKREPFALPKLKIKRKLSSIDDLREEDFELIGYESHPAIKGEMAI